MTTKRKPKQVKRLRWSDVHPRVRDEALRLTGGRQDHLTIISPTEVRIDNPRSIRSV